MNVKGDLSVFPDFADVSGYAAEAMECAVGIKLINGSTNPNGGADLLLPKGTTTRAQCAQMFLNYSKN